MDWTVALGLAIFCLAILRILAHYARAAFVAWRNR